MERRGEERRGDERRGEERENRPFASLGHSYLNLFIYFSLQSFVTDLRVQTTRRPKNWRWTIWKECGRKRSWLTLNTILGILWKDWEYTRNILERIFLRIFFVFLSICKLIPFPNKPTLLVVRCIANRRPWSVYEEILSWLTADGKVLLLKNKFKYFTKFNFWKLWNTKYMRQKDWRTHSV